ncbi:MAG: 50S ribosomal protein L16 [Mycoplasma sp.]|nr:50S ribosomal protein L16 [Mycoplasma sp.]
MLQPKKTKYRKPHNVYHDSKKATKGNFVNFGTFGLQATTSAWVTSRQIEAARIAINKKMGKEGQIIIRIFPHFAKTSKPIGVRMGKGKGNPEKWVAVVRVNTVCFEVKGVSSEIAKLALRSGGHKLPIKWRIIENAENKLGAKV